MRARTRAMLLIAVAVTVCAVSVAPADAREEAQKVDVTDLARDDVDVEVFMVVDATGDEIATVERALRTSDLVERYATLDKDAALKEFKRIFRRDPKLVASITAKDLPVSFRLDLRHKSDRQRVYEVFDPLPGVKSVTIPLSKGEQVANYEELVILCAEPTIRDEVFMTVAATTQQVAAVRSAIEASADVVSFRYLDKAAAYEEFKRIFRTEPDLVKKITAADLPESFRVEVARDREDALRTSLSALPGVKKIGSSSDVCTGIGRATSTTRG